VSEPGFHPAPRESERVSLSLSLSLSGSRSLARSRSVAADSGAGSAAAGSAAERGVAGSGAAVDLAKAVKAKAAGSEGVWVRNVGRVTYLAEDVANVLVADPGHVDTGAEPPRATGGCRSPERAGEELPSHDVAESDSGTEHNRLIAFRQARVVGERGNVAGQHAAHARLGGGDGDNHVSCVTNAAGRGDTSSATSATRSDGRGCLSARKFLKNLGTCESTRAPCPLGLRV